MQHGHVLKKLNFDLLTPSQGLGWVLRAKYCYHVARFVIRFNLICNVAVFWKRWILTNLPPSPWLGGICGKNICYHVAAFVILFSLTCNMIIFWKKSLILTFWPQKQGQWVGEGSVGKVVATMLLHLWFPLIWYATWPWSEKIKLTYWPHHQGRGWGLRANYCYHFAAFVILLNLICNMTMFWKSWILAPGSGVWGGIWGQILATMLLHLAIPFNLICNITLF